MIKLLKFLIRLVATIIIGATAGIVALLLWDDKILKDDVLLHCIWEED